MRAAVLVTLLALYAARRLDTSFSFSKLIQQVSAASPDIAAKQEQTDAAPQWDPVSCWDCGGPHELERMFFSGLILATPSFIFSIRRRTRRREKLARTRILEI